MKLKFMRVDYSSSLGRSSIWFRDQFGQPRFFDLPGKINEKYAQELLNEVERLFLYNVNSISS